jgi:hypothetical protein
MPLTRNTLTGVCSLTSVSRNLSCTQGSAVMCLGQSDRPFDCSADTVAASQSRGNVLMRLEGVEAPLAQSRYASNNCEHSGHPRSGAGRRARRSVPVSASRLERT